jgi:hypothetical protein
MSKIFNLTCTDGQFDGNVLTDSISSQSLGLILPNATLTFAQGNYEATNMAWRIQDSQTLRVKSVGFGNLAGLDCMESASITPVRIGPNDILGCYPMPAAAATKTNTLLWIKTTKSTELFTATGASDNTATNCVSAINSMSFGDLFFGSTLQEVMVQVQDNAALNDLEVVNEAGAVVMTIQGNKRGATGGSRSNKYNLHAKNLNIRVGKGWEIRTNASSV